MSDATIEPSDATIEPSDATIEPSDATIEPSDATIGHTASPLAEGIGLLRIDHVGVAVPDLDAAIAFYARVFGMRCVHVETNEQQGVREAMLAVGPSTTGGRVQLLAPLSPDSTIGRFLDRHGPGLQQVAYTVADVDAACTALRDRGVRLLYDAPRTGTAGSRINFVHPKDAGGVLVELVESANAG